MPRATLAMENAALRQHLTICRRTQKRARLRPEDRLEQLGELGPLTHSNATNHDGPPAGHFGRAARTGRSGVAILVPGNAWSWVASFTRSHQPESFRDLISPKVGTDKSLIQVGMPDSIRSKIAIFLQ